MSKVLILPTVIPIFHILYHVIAYYSTMFVTMPFIKRPLYMGTLTFSWDRLLH